MDDPTTTPLDEAPLSSETDQPSETDSTETEPTENVEELKEKLAAAEEEALRWKNRVKEENPKKKDTKQPVTEDDIDWKIMNANRINLVKDAYQQELDELTASGAKVTNELREKALRYAEATQGIAKPKASEALPEPGVDRTAKRTPEMNQYDKALGVKPETKEEYRDYVEGV